MANVLKRMNIHYLYEPMFNSVFIKLKFIVFTTSLREWEIVNKRTFENTNQSIMH